MNYSDDLSRRQFIHQIAYNAAVAAAVALVPGVTFATAGDSNAPGLQWKKTPCRFCGVGCGLLVGVASGKAVAVRGDPASPVNKGLCCVKGYHTVQMLYAQDRLKSAKVRKNGKLVTVPLKEALDLVAQKMQSTMKEHGKNAVAMYGSGQWTIPDGYIASKFMKGGLGTNNLEANARLCMASAVTGFITSFGADEPMGCYEDIDHGDTFVLWGNNMAEMHPVLFSRLLDRRLRNKNVRIIDLATRTTRTSFASDHTFLFKPQTDLAIANAICHELIRTKKVNQRFVENYCSIKSGKTDIGYGLEDGFSFKDKPKTENFAAFKEFLKDYSPEAVEKISGVKAKDIKYMASLFGDPNRNVVSFWCMGMNQHTRGTWINNLVYNIHLLVGKISRPGNGPFSLTGQPSACGTVREVGTLTHRLPYGVVMNPKHREKAAKIWDVPVDRIDPAPSAHTVAMFRKVDKGDIRFLWIQVTNPMVTMPKLNRYRSALKKDDNFIVVSDVFPTPTTDVADVILPSSLWIEKEGMFGNSERRTQHFDQLVNPPGEATPDGWQIIEVARRMGQGKLFPWKQETYIADVWKEYRKFHDNDQHNMAPYEVLRKYPGVQWPFVNGKETKWRYNKDFDPAAKSQFDFYGKKDGRAVIWLRPFEKPPESPDADYPLWLCTGRVLEHWHSGSMTRRIPVLHQAVPEAYVEIHPQDAELYKIREGDQVEISSRRGKLALNAVIKGRGLPKPGEIFVPFFDENYLINEVTLDAYCPISKQPDYKKCAVKIKKV